MKVHTYLPDARRPRHATGEVVWATVGNYLENRAATPKVRPVVILRASQCQHWIAGLTTQAATRYSGEPRTLVPLDRVCDLCGTSYLWSSRPSRLCRLDVRGHIGWIDREILAVLEKHMQLPWHMRADLRAATAAMTNTDGAVPAATL